MHEHTKATVTKKLTQQYCIHQLKFQPIEKFSDSSEQASDIDEEVAKIQLKEDKEDREGQESPTFKSRFQRPSLQLRRFQSHTGAQDEQLSLKKQESSPFKRFPHLSGKQIRKMQTLKTWKRIHLASEMLYTATSSNVRLL